MEELDRFALRDRIRSGDVHEATELALAGTDDWKPAGQYPELVRYFELAVTRTSVGTVAVSAAPRPVEPMAHRVVQGLAYPVSGGGFVVLLCLAILGVLPLVGIFASLASTVIMLDVIRRSADGKLTFSALVDTSDAWSLVRHYVRVLFVTLVAGAPAIVVIVWSIARVFAGTWSLPTALAASLAAMAFSAIYFPACLATVAVWDNVISALDPTYVFRVIKIIGGDYFVVIAMWFVATAVTIVMNRISPMRFIPFVGGIVDGFLSNYVLFYASHLLGYAVYRHATDLGWD